jgi:TetR/AcrR family transcriptional regulator, transcriptional repressor for nem operon
MNRMTAMKPKSFDPEKTLAVIAETFARYGYEGTTLDELSRSTGLGKQSLYNAYGDKKAMVAKALRCFGQCSPGIQILSNASLNGREKIERFFEATIAEAADYKNPGCLITNLLLEKGATDIEVLKIASARWNETRSAFQNVIEAGVKDRSIRSKFDPDSLSLMLMNLLSGLRVTVRASGDMEKIKKVVRNTLQAIL